MTEATTLMIDALTRVNDELRRKNELAAARERYQTAKQIEAAEAAFSPGDSAILPSGRVCCIVRRVVGAFFEIDLNGVRAEVHLRHLKPE